MKTIQLKEVAQHNKKDDIWLILYGKVYDLTDFLPEHPGGESIILQLGGTDATEEFDLIHSSDIIRRFLSSDMCIGQVEPAKTTAECNMENNSNQKQLTTVITSDSNKKKPIPLALDTIPCIEEVQNTFDFQSVAKQVLKSTAYSYFSSGSGDNMTMRENHNAYHRIWFRPQIMVDVSKVDTSTEMLGAKVSFPLYISATSFCKMAHPEGEKALARAAGNHGIIQIIPTLASCSLDEITDARIHSKQPQWLQLYVSTDRKMTQRIIQQAEKNGIQGLFITVDRAIVGPRGGSRNDKDMFDDEGGVQKVLSNERGTTSNILPLFVDPSLNWNDIAWFKSITKMPIILKGVQRWEDAVRAWRHGCAGIVLSNHGGRQLDFAPSPIEILPEVMDALKREGCNLKKDFDVYIDGGIRRGSDIFKALALGAKGVGIARPALYALSCYGEKGVEHLLNLLRNEFEMTMRLMGTKSIKDIEPDMVDIRNLKDHFVANPTDHLSKYIYERLKPRGNLSRL